MAKLSPLQIVKRDFKSKEALVNQLTSRLERFEDEDADVFRARLMSVSNKKLLKLNAAAGRVESEFGNKEKLVDAIVGLKFTKPNADYRSKLMGQRITRLLDLHGSLS